MRVLALETVTRAGSLALATGAECHVHPGDPAQTHGVRLPGDVLTFLQDHHCTLADIDIFAVVVGPGSFTGLRVGVAAVQGFAMASGRPVVSMPTLDAMADAWILASPPIEPTLVVACLDGQRDDVFFAGWMANDGTPVDGTAALIEPQVGRREDLEQRIHAWSGDTRVVIVGDGVRHRADLFGATGSVELTDVPLTLAEVAARTALRHPERAGPPHAVRPIYIRRPDAELARSRANAANDVKSAKDAADVVGLAIGQASAPHDVTAVADLQRRAFRDAWGAESIQWELQNTDVARLYVMRTPAGALVAYCACWVVADELHINSLAVEDAWRRRGVARRLLRHVFQDAVSTGATSATLEVRQSNVAGRALYEHLGFSVEGVRRDYYREPREDALILWNRNLGALES